MLVATSSPQSTQNLENYLKKELHFDITGTVPSYGSSKQVKQKKK
jgi:hypothetical protein